MGDEAEVVQCPFKGCCASYLLMSQYTWMFSTGIMHSVKGTDIMMNYIWMNAQFEDIMRENKRKVRQLTQIFKKKKKYANIWITRSHSFVIHVVAE